MLRTYLRYEPEEISLPPHATNVSPTKLLESAFEELKNIPFEIHSSYMRKLASTKDIHEVNSAVVHEAVVGGKRNKPVPELLKFFSPAQLLSIACEGSTLHITILTLEELARRKPEDVEFSEEDYESIEDILPEKRNGCARVALYRNAFIHGLGTFERAEQAMLLNNESLEQLILSFIVKSHLWMMILIILYLYHYYVVI